MPDKAPPCAGDAEDNSLGGYPDKHIMIYGACPLSNRKYALDLLRSLSPSTLRYERKIVYQGDKHAINIVVSDVHYEIDMSLLGRNSRSVWHQVHTTIVDSIRASQSKKGIILCKNFENCCADLVRVFFSYLQRPMVVLTPIRFIILTSQYAFIPNSVRLRCRAVSVRTTTPSSVRKWTATALCHRILGCILGEVDIPDLRNVLYGVQIYLFTLDKISWCLIHQVAAHRKKQQNPITCEELHLVVRHIIECSYSYSMCYRPIFHLEKLALGLAGIVNA